MRRRRARSRRRLQRLHLQPPRAARASSSAPAHAFRSTSRHRGAAAGLGASGARACSTACTGCSRSALVEQRTGRVVLARDRLGRQAAVPGRAPAAALRAASTLPALLAARRRRHERRPGRAAPLPVAGTPSCPAPRTILRGVRKLAAGDACWSSSPTAAAASARYWNPPFERDRRRGWTPRTGGRGARGAARGRAAADGRRRAGRHPALRRAGLEPDRRAARRGGPARAGDVLDRLPGRGRARGQRVRVLGPRRRASSGPTTTRSGSAPTSSWRRCRGRSPR